MNSDLKHLEEFCEILVAKKIEPLVLFFFFSLVSLFLFCYKKDSIRVSFSTLPQGRLRV